MSPLEALGLLRFPSDVLIETRAGRAISGIIEITDSGIASFKAFIERMTDPPISPEDVDALVTNRGRREHPPIMEW